MKDKDVKKSLIKDIISHKEEHKDNGQVLLPEPIASPPGHTNKQLAGKKHNLITDLLAEEGWRWERAERCRCW